MYNNHLKISIFNKSASGLLILPEEGINFYFVVFKTRPILYMQKVPLVCNSKEYLHFSFIAARFLDL
jgi:hypothetical protein